MAGRSPTDIDRQIGQRIVHYRQAAGVTQKDAAAALGISFQQFQKYEKGQNRISAGNLHALAIRLCVPVERFFDVREEAF
ncbi:helix-turn-helix domain-containing protein [Methylobacterium sp. sgz302541]|uniref:helix-turn-helix domain-containing protein n=1 Tax=unclassified Methylobacterium TaxID=2615210 RepID=UPI003D34DCAC